MGQVQNTKIPSGKIGLALFLATEIMLFGGFISSFLIVKARTVTWPPINQPRLPVVITGINTLILILSGILIILSVRSLIAKNNIQGLKFLITSTIFGGVFFLVQGYEWIQLIQHGLTVSSSMYGSTFYVIIGLHALHVLVALLFLIRSIFIFKKGSYTSNPLGLELVKMYWLFVVCIWPVLYGLIYF